MNNWKRENNIALIEIEKLPNTTEEALVLPQDPMTHPTKIKGENLERNDW